MPSMITSIIRKIDKKRIPKREQTKKNRKVNANKVAKLGEGVLLLRHVIPAFRVARQTIQFFVASFSMNNFCAPRNVFLFAYEKNI